VSAPRVIVAGNVTVDDVIYPDGQVAMGQLGGNAVYASVGCRLTGAPTEIVSRYGADTPDGLLAGLAALGVSLAALRAYDGPTTRAWLVYGPDGQRHFVPRSTGPTLCASDLPSLHGSPVVLLCALPLHVAAPLVAAVRAAAPCARIVLDSHESWGSDLAAVLEVARRVDVFAPSQDELAALTGFDAPERSLAELHAAGVPAAVVKLGARGALLADGLVAAPRVEQVDPTGAGDTFCGALAGGLALGAALRQSVTAACLIAAESVRRVGSTALAMP
jgi:sugar/nucleoside kinase (ribokinase family)